MTDYLKKINQLDAQFDNPLIHDQIKEVNQIDRYMKEKKILPTAPRRLGFYPNEVEKLESCIPRQQKGNIKVTNQLLNSMRQYLSINYGVWSLPNLETAKLIKEQFKISYVLEIMAGNAYWSKALTEVGLKTIATDSLEWSKTSRTGSQQATKVLNLSAPEAIRAFPDVQLVICAWAPNFDESDLSAIEAWQKYNPSSRLLFIGEKNGVTNSATFWHQIHFSHSPELQTVNHSFTSFDFIEEQIFEIKHEI